MSWLSTVFLCVFTAVTTLGALRRVGWITVHPEHVHGAGSRKAFVTAVQAGDIIVDKGLDAGAIIIKKGCEFYDATKGRRRRRVED